MFVDWQFLTQGDNMFDLGMTILHNTNFATNTEVIKELLTCYYNTFNTMTSSLGGEETKESLEEFTNRFYTVGVKSAFLIGSVIDDGFLHYEVLLERVLNMAKLMPDD